jgi:uncharacterized membrane protein YuzA (DUF378 family)
MLLWAWGKMSVTAMLYALIGLSALLVVAVFVHTKDDSRRQRRHYDLRHRGTYGAFSRRIRI